MSGSVWVIALALPCLTVSAVSVVKSEAVVARHRAEGLADRAALGAAVALSYGDPAEACRSAMLIVATDGGRISACEVTADRVRVRVSLGARLPLVGAVTVNAVAAAQTEPDTSLPAPEVPPAFEK